MRNAGLNRMQCCVPSAWVTKKQAVRQMMNEPGRVPVWCYLGETFERTQMTIIVYTLKAAGLEQQVSVEIPGGIERHPLDRTPILPKTISTAAKAISRVPK